MVVDADIQSERGSVNRGSWRGGHGRAHHLSDLRIHSMSKGSHWMLSTEGGTGGTCLWERSCWLMRERG